MILALELSTSAVKALLYDGERVADTLTRKLPDDVSRVTYIDADGAVTCLLDAAATLVSHNTHYIIDCVALSTIWHSFVPLDQHYRPMAACLTWADTLAADTVHAYRERVDTAALYNATGCPPHSNYMLWKWLHYREYGSDATYAASLADYLYYAFTGQFASSNCMFSGTGLLSHLDYDVFRIAQLSPTQLSATVGVTHTAPLLPHIADALRISRDTPCVVPNPDGALNHYAVAGGRYDILSLSVGTSAAIRRSMTHYTVSDDGSTFCYAGYDSDYWLTGAPTSGAGNCVEWFAKRVLRGAYSYAALDAAASRIDVDNAPHFLPFLYGERAPSWRDDRFGAFHDMGADCDHAALYYAVLEGVLFNIRQCYERLRGLSTGDIRYVNISGGIIQSPYWLQLCADVLGVPLEVNDVEHTSLLGAAYTGMLATGAWRSLADVPLADGKRLYPSERRDALERRYARYLEIYRRDYV